MLKLIRENEIHREDIQGAVFYWRRPSWAERQKVFNTYLGILKPAAPEAKPKKKSRKKAAGLQDPAAAAVAQQWDDRSIITIQIAAYLTGWEGVGGETEEEYKPELVQYLPYDVVYELGARMGLIVGQKEKDAGGKKAPAGPVGSGS